MYIIYEMFMTSSNIIVKEQTDKIVIKTAAVSSTISLLNYVNW